MDILKLFDDFQDCEKLNPTLQRVLTADKELSEALTAIDNDGTAYLDIDRAVGSALFAYQQQGFVFGFNMARYMMKLLTDWNDGLTLDDGNGSGINEKGR